MGLSELACASTDVRTRPTFRTGRTFLTGCGPGLCVWFWCAPGASGTPPGHPPRVAWRQFPVAAVNGAGRLASRRPIRQEIEFRTIGPGRSMVEFRRGLWHSRSQRRRDDPGNYAQSRAGDIRRDGLSPRGPPPAGRSSGRAAHRPPREHEPSAHERCFIPTGVVGDGLLDGVLRAPAERLQLRRIRHGVSGVGATEPPDDNR